MRMRVGKMKKILLLVVALITFTAGASFAGGTLEEAKAFAEKAVAFYEANGQEKAFAEINDPKGKFVKGDLYVAVADFKGVTLAHGGNPKLIGKSMMEVKDASPAGKLFMAEMIELAKTKGAGWVDYMWTNPESKKIEPKSAYVIRAKGKDMLFLCGAYGKR